MLILKADHDDEGAIALPDDAPPSFEESVAGPSSSSGTAFSDPNSSQGGLKTKLVDVDDPEEARGSSSRELLALETSSPPPEFAPFHAEYEVQNKGDIVSHDPHLNDDGKSFL